jgi:hypothetical protein
MFPVQGEGREGESVSAGEGRDYVGLFAMNVSGSDCTCPSRGETPHSMDCPADPEPDHDEVGSGRPCRPRCSGLDREGVRSSNGCAYEDHGGGDMKHWKSWRRGYRDGWRDSYRSAAIMFPLVMTHEERMEMLARAEQRWAERDAECPG